MNKRPLFAAQIPPEELPTLDWFVRFSSKICDRFSLVHRQSTLCILGEDYTGTVTMEARIRGVVTFAVKSVSPLMISPERLQAAIACMSGVESLQLKFFANKIELLGRNEGEMTYNVDVVRAMGQRSFSQRSVRKFSLPRNIFLALSKARPGFDSDVRITVKGRKVELVSKEASTLLSVTLPNVIHERSVNAGLQSSHI